MPNKAMTPCVVCKRPCHGRRCELHQTEVYQQDRERRGSARERGYDSQWDKARRTYLTRHPLCVQCEKEGRVVVAVVVDHVVPHKGDQRLFWDTANWQALCVMHHNRKTRTQDM
jgi:5-methylcytosine-specific restriction enzyme A